MSSTPTQLANLARLAILGPSALSEQEICRHPNGVIPATAAEDPNIIRRNPGFNRLEKESLERAKRLALEAQRERESAFWQQKEAERLAIVRAEHYVHELAEIASHNASIDQLEMEKAKSNRRLFEAKERMMVQSDDLDKMRELAFESAGLEKLLPMIEDKIARLEKNIELLHGENKQLAYRIHDDLDNRWRAWQRETIERMRAEICQEWKAKHETEIDDELADLTLKALPEYQRLDATLELPSKTCSDINEWQQSIKTIEDLEALTAPKVVEPALAHAEPHVVSKVEKPTRLKSSKELVRA